MGVVCKLVTLQCDADVHVGESRSRVVVRSRVPFRCVDAPVAPRPFWPSLGVARGCVPWVLRCASHTRRRMSHWDEFLERRLLWAAHMAEGGDFQPASQL